MNHRLLGTVAIAAPIALIFGLLIVLMDVEHAAVADPCAPLDDAAATVASDLDLEGLVPGYDVEQLTNATIIMRAAADLDLGLADQVIGIMTALGESTLRNLEHGDAAGPDSLGLFQQRANGAWGSKKDRLDPHTAATNFFKALMKVEDRYTLEPTVAANRVQNNADPYHYRKHYLPARQITEALKGEKQTQKSVEDSWNLGDVQPQLVALVAEVTARFPQIQTVGGWRESATDPNGHPAGLAADFMVPMTEQGEALGGQISTWIQDNHRELGVDYVLWKQRIWSSARSAEGWRSMSDRGSPTANHEDHVHVNVFPTGTKVATPTANGVCPGEGVSQNAWVHPVEGAPITSDFGMRTHPIRGDQSFHGGIDYGATCGTKIRAASTGLVVKAGTDSIYGHQIVIDHGSSLQTLYGHMYANGVLVRVGTMVSTGQVIGEVGSDGLSTGCHLHFSVKTSTGFKDPTDYLKEASKE